MKEIDWLSMSPEKYKEKLKHLLNKPKSRRKSKVLAKSRHFDLVLRRRKIK
jgi:hypothetical protein